MDHGGAAAPEAVGSPGECKQGDPQKTFRKRFRDVLLRNHLSAVIRCINAAEKLDEITIDRAIRELECSDKPGGLARNRELTEKLIKGVSVHRAVAGDGSHSRNVTVRFIDYWLIFPPFSFFIHPVNATISGNVEVAAGKVKK